MRPPISAATASALSQRIEDLGHTVTLGDPPLADIAHTLAVRRGHQAARVVVMARSSPQLLAGLRSALGRAGHAAASFGQLPSSDR